MNAAEVVAALRTPTIHVAPGTAEAASTHALILTPRLRIVHAQRKEGELRIEHVLDQMSKEESSAGNPNDHRDLETTAA